VIVKLAVPTTEVSQLRRHNKAAQQETTEPQEAMVEEAVVEPELSTDTAVLLEGKYTKLVTSL
jgi:hypothetical protein